ncbi:hypothetical protein CYMTET_24427 [Cymbomonas tetramitiformis]|uniref:CBS domain-containing protein n=1 Tax=Cymbomonas tetramitiformis TaxID=36881 RepID=A0AAE0KZY9_9CHLO|nr:hypothetical protein CYMTET_24427 [Cymbomonas tetramitiformis]
MFEPGADELFSIRFEWRYGGRQVHLCGSFTRWLETVPMAPDQVTGVFAVVCNLPPGVHQYKFIVDGEWRHDEGQPFMPDPLGNVNNWIFVGAPGSNPGGPHALQQPQPMSQLPSEGTTLNPNSGLPWSLAAEQPQTMATTSSAPAPLPQQGAGLGAPVMPSAETDPETTRSRISEFLHRHTAYELIPESGKVVVLDTALPVQQAFHALFEQGLPSAPLWESSSLDFVGIISASDFINILHRLRSKPVSDAELAQLTLARWRVEAAKECGDGWRLVSVRPEDSLHTVAQTLLQCGYKSVPVLTSNEYGGSAPKTSREREVPQLLHLATLSGVLGCMARHFRHAPTALPLLSQPLGALGAGTWNEDDMPRDGDDTGMCVEGDEKQTLKKGCRLYTLQPNTPLTVAMRLLLQAEVSALPIVDDNNILLDIYARSDVVALARDQAYSQLNLDEITVTEALTYCGGRDPNGDSQAGGMASSSGRPEPANVNVGPGQPVGMVGRAYTVCRASPLRAVLDGLATPGIQRLVCVQVGTNRVEGIISLRDIASLLFV